MAIALTQKYLEEIRKGSNTPNAVIEVELDGGKRFFGFHGRNALPITRYIADGAWRADGSLFAVGSDEINFVEAVLRSASSLQNRLDPKAGYSTRGEMKCTVAGRDNFKDLIKDNYLKNRRVTRKDGFIAPGFTYVDYAAVYTGRISDWTRKGDELTLTVSDDLADGTKKIPVENSTKTQRIDYTGGGAGLNPVDIMTDMLTEQLGIDPALVDTAKFAAEKDLWLTGWKFSRVITEPQEANKFLNELQAETNSFIIHDGEKVSYKVFAPPVPGQTVEEWTDANHILEESLDLKSGYRDGFFNRIVVYYDYDESGSDGEENFESALISVDAASQDASQWDEVSTKTIKSRWMRSVTHGQPVNITGVRIYHVSVNNGTGSGTMTFTYDAENGSSLQWTPPGGTPGEAVRVTRDGKYQVFGSDRTKYIRVVVETWSLPASSRTDTITLSSLGASNMAITLANKLLNRYRDPACLVSLEVGLSNSAYNSVFIKPTDLKDITTDEACEKGLSAWTKKRVMLISVRPDPGNHRVKLEAVDTRMYRRYVFIAPAGYPDYPSATSSQRERAFIGDANNMVSGGTVDGYYIW